MKNSQSRKMKGSRFIYFMAFLSTFFIIIALYPLLVGMDDPAIEKLKLAELGGYFSGIFNPLLFLWVIISYVYQHNSSVNDRENFEETLSLSKRNLELQEEIYKRESLERFLSSQPNFINVDTEKFAVQGIWADGCQVKFTNVGLDASDVYIEDEFGFCMSEKLPIIKRGESISIKIDLPFFSDNFSIEGTRRRINLKESDVEGNEDNYSLISPDFQKCWVSYNDTLGLRQRAYLHLYYTPFLIDGKRIIRASIDMQKNPNQYKPTPLKDDESGVVEDVN